MKILVINCGSSSVKYRLFAMPAGEVLVAGMVERIGEAEGRHRCENATDGAQRSDTLRVANHREALAHIMRSLTASGAVADLSELGAIGHRVVHGGELFRQPTRVDDAVIARIRELVPLAPLHNPAGLAGIEISLQVAPGVPQIAVFDTAFHQGVPDYAFHYALPRHLYTEYRVRRYGFHGISYSYVCQRAAAFLRSSLEGLNLIALHLGNGASAAAVAGGRSVETSMGMTPLEGLIMGTRSGDIDPAIPFYLEREAGLAPGEVEDMLNRESGLKGLCGSNDMREVHRLAESGDQAACLALEMVCHRLRKYIGAYSAVLGRVDALVFTGGIGENDAWLRAHTCSGLATLGIDIDPRSNTGSDSGERAIHHDASQVAVLVIPTNEELEIARQVSECLNAP
ncbi:MAG: acetate/propionate family kinase [Thiogranum sp.]